MSIISQPGFALAAALRCMVSRLMLLTFIVSVTGCAWLDSQQRAAIYRPSFVVAKDFHGLEPNDELVYLDLSDSRKRQVAPASKLTRDEAQKALMLQEAAPSDMKAYISAWWLPSNKPNAPTLLYCHGVFRNLTYNYPKIKALREAGFNVLAITYRGWPNTSKELPSEQSIYADARRGWEELKYRQSDAAKRVIYGHSMGGGVAVQLAFELNYPRDYAVLMLESTFTTLPDVGAELRWYGALLRPFATQQFDSVNKIGQIKAPVLIRHGERDNTVPFVLGQRLFSAANEPKTFVTFEKGSHSGLHAEQPERYRRSVWQFWLEAQEFLQNLPTKQPTAATVSAGSR